MSERWYIPDQNHAGRNPETSLQDQVPHIEVEGQRDPRLRPGRCEHVLIGRARRFLLNGLDIVTGRAKGLNGRLRDVLVGEEPAHPAARRAA